MRDAFAHDAVLLMPADADVRAQGAAVTVALCGLHGPDGVETRWRLVETRPCVVSESETDHARRLIGT
jgi:hypothetical protein